MADEYAARPARRPQRGPLEIGCGEGNKAGKLTILPIIKQFTARHELADFVVVADAGMLSETNLADLKEARFRFIDGSHSIRAPVDLASNFGWHGEIFTDGRVINTITPKTQRAGTGEASDPKKRAEPVWDPVKYPSS